jgi:ferredoxin/ribosome-associated translation inhibitor RaiA
MEQIRDIYRALQKHLDSLPVGFPATKSGEELNILRLIFTESEAAIVLKMGYQLEPLDSIYARMDQSQITKEQLKQTLAEMNLKGGILWVQRNGIDLYAAINFIVGMLEMQCHRYTPEMAKNTFKYSRKAYGFQYLSTPVPQMRVIPIEESVTPEQNIATYDEMRSILERAEGPIIIGDCLCRKGMAMAKKPCTKTTRQHVCIALNEFAQQAARAGWGKEITREEALGYLRQSEAEGLVLQPSNAQQPEFICSCCRCCCGILLLLKSVPRPADFVASNYRAEIDPDGCVACGVCVERCQMEAVKLDDKEQKSKVDPARCIGCGVCVPTCATGAIHLNKKAKEIVPPKTNDDLYDFIMAHKKNKLQKAALGMKILLGKVKSS